MKHTLIAFMLLFSLGLSAQSSIYFGVGGAYNLDSSDLGVQGKMRKIISNDFDVELMGTYFFGDQSLYTIDGNMHYIGLSINDTVQLIPFAGLNYINFKKAVTDVPTDTKVTDQRQADIGLNIGLEITIPVGRSHIYVNGKYVFEGLDATVLSAGIYF